MRSLKLFPSMSISDMTSSVNGAVLFQNGEHICIDVLLDDVLASVVEVRVSPPHRRRGTVKTLSDLETSC